MTVIKFLLSAVLAALFPINMSGQLYKTVEVDGIYYSLYGTSIEEIHDIAVHHPKDADQGYSWYRIPDTYKV